MHATAQPLPEVSPVSLDLNPPVRAESIDLRALIGHRTGTQASASVEGVAEIFKTGSVNFIAVLEEQRLLGMCSRPEIAALLGGRYGFSLWARKPIRDGIRLGLRLPSFAPFTRAGFVDAAMPESSCHPAIKKRFLGDLCERIGAAFRAVKLAGEKRRSLQSVVDIAPKDQSNRRKRLPQCAVWEIHPVMALHVVQ